MPERMPMRRDCATLLFVAALGVAGCAAEAPIAVIDEPTGPQVAPGDPCNGVVPQLCPV